MFDFSFGELALVVLVALLVVGPKDLPVVIRTVGKWMGQLKGITNEFRTGFKSALDELSMGNVEQEIKSIHEETKFIRDEQGNLQRVYDISDFADKATHPVPDTLKLDDAGNKS